MYLAIFMLHTSGWKSVVFFYSKNSQELLPLNYPHYYRLEELEWVSRTGDYENSKESDRTLDVVDIVFQYLFKHELGKNDTLFLFIKHFPLF